MNFIFISPHFPRTYFNFCDRLKKNGVNVLGIGDCPYDALDYNVKASLNEYYYLPNMLDYNEMYKAVAYFASKYGRIDWIESNNEFWLETDANLRTDFNVNSGIKNDNIKYFKSKAEMKTCYKKAGVPTARCHKVKGYKDTKEFIDKVSFPVILKPESGVGASDTFKIEDDKELEEFFKIKPDEAYVCEEFITGDIVSYDAISNSKAEPLFESMTEFPPSIADIVNKDLDLSYYVRKDVDPKLREYGRSVIKAFGAKSRFVHLEFFRLTKDIEGIGKKGDYAGLEVNMRPAGGYTPDMMNFAHSIDVYKIWADMVTIDSRVLPESKDEYYCVYASRKDNKKYVHTHDEILDKYNGKIVMCERMPDALAAAMGNQNYTVKLETKKEVSEFIKFVQEQVK